MSPHHHPKERRLCLSLQPEGDSTGPAGGRGKAAAKEPDGRGAPGGKKGFRQPGGDPGEEGPGGRRGAGRSRPGRQGCSGQPGAPPPAAPRTYSRAAVQGAARGRREFGGVEPHEGGQRLRHPVGDHGHGAEHDSNLE